MKQETKATSLALCVLGLLTTLPAALAADSGEHAAYGVAGALQRLEPHFGATAAAYWAGAPRSLVTFMVGTTTFLPILTLIAAALTRARAPALGAQVRSVLRLAVAMSCVNVANHIACTLALLGTGLALSSSWPWAAHSVVATTLGTVPYLALGTLCTGVGSRRRWRVAGALVFAFVLQAASQALIYLKVGIFLLPTFALREGLLPHLEHVALGALAAVCWMALSIMLPFALRRSIASWQLRRIHKHALVQ
jgi:hypothetical protein